MRSLHFSTATRLSIPLICALALSGCAQISKEDGHYEEQAEQFSRVDKHSSFPSVRRLNFEQVNLVEMIDPGNTASGKYPLAWKNATALNGAAEWGRKYDLVLAAFRESVALESAKQAHRNSVQDRILGVATSRCNVFKTYLRRQQTDTNFLLGSATTVAGVLGAVLPGVTASRNLAGAAGMLSGVQAEYNANYYSNLAAHVIVQGIETHQARLQTQVIQARQPLSLAEYSMEAAIKDAIHYDGTCSTVTGLLEAAESIKEVTNPGLPRAAEIIAAVKATGEIAKSDNISDLMSTGKLAKLLKQASPSTSPLIVASVKPGGASGNVMDQLAMSSQAESRIREAVATHAAELAGAYGAARLKRAVADRGEEIPFKVIAEKFTNTVNATITASFSVSACVSALGTPAKAYGEKYAAYLVTPPEDAGARIQAGQELDAATAGLRGATRRVDLQIEVITKMLADTVESWKAAAIQKDFTLGDQKAAPPDQNLSLLCE